jgi:hypothetical protein
MIVDILRHPDGSNTGIAKDFLAKNVNLADADQFGGRVPFSTMANCACEKASRDSCQGQVLLPFAVFFL